MKDRPSTMVILSYCDVMTTLYVCRVCKRWLEDVEHYWKIVKRLVFFKHVHVVPGSILKNNNKLMWLARQCHNLRILDVRWCSVSVPTLIALIEVSPFLEIFQSCLCSAPVLEALFHSCSKLHSLVLSHNVLEWSQLQQFRRLRALEIGDYGTPLTGAHDDIVKTLQHNPNLEIVHVLGYSRGFDLIDALNPLSLKSLAVPYERDPINVKKVQKLRDFVCLVNLNFGQSRLVSAAVLFETARHLPQLRALSFNATSDIVTQILPKLADGTLFPNLRHFGCRNRNHSHDIVYQNKQILMHNYELDRGQPRDWCYPVFSVLAWLSEFGTDLHDQWG